jgi:hypothetical protein
MRPRVLPGAAVQPGAWWRFGKCEGVIVRVYPGGSGNKGIAHFEGDIPDAHIHTMLCFTASWTYLPDGPTVPALPPPCTCRDLGGVLLSDGCALHDATRSRVVQEQEDRRLSA